MENWAHELQGEHGPQVTIKEGASSATLCSHPTPVGVEAGLGVWSFTPPNSLSPLAKVVETLASSAAGDRLHLRPHQCAGRDVLHFHLKDCYWLSDLMNPRSNMDHMPSLTKDPTASWLIELDHELNHQNLKVHCLMCSRRSRESWVSIKCFCLAITPARKWI